MTQPIHQVDAFTDRPFSGNPAAVCVLDRPAEERWMQSVALEMNLSETAFLHRAGDAWSLRWFTPAVEVELCGHATLAAAHVLWETNRLAPDEQARFDTKSGRLVATRRGNFIELDFPARPAAPAEPPAGLIDALGVAAIAVGRSRYDWLVEIGSEAEVRACAPDFKRLAQVEARGVMITSRSSDPAFDCVSRFFAPASGIDEDPVTGSAHCTLGPWWGAKLGRNALDAYQASARGGKLRITLAGDRVLLAGRAVTVLRGELLTPPA
jgi:PhzF family phenazine biosynthesis protein